jgi:hypothetical protein
VKKLLIKIIKAYQRAPLSSHGACRYTPTCSQYAIDAIEEYGAFKGTFMAIWRILRCNPFSKGGVDPVPKRKR